MFTIFIDKKIYTVKKSENLLHTCLSLGINLPYFCWHPILGSIGACRQCAIKIYSDKNDQLGRIAMACMTPLQNNMIISIDEKEAKNFRKSNIEYLMIHHPHDCPICAEGGNCHLQDMTVMTKHHNRKYNFSKKIYKNQYLGHFISHEMNRCISCYRCVRYYKDYCDGKDFGVYGSGQRMYFGRLESGELENEHSGNLIEICPTGVFTDKLHKKNYNRKWDMQYSPNICQYCSIGCNILSGERYGYIRRIENRYNYNINQYFICDLGRFGYGHSNLKNRIKNPYIVKNKKKFNLSSQEACNIAVKIIKSSNKIIGIGSSRASLESNYALLNLVGKKNFSNGMLDSEYKNILLFIKLLENSGIKSVSLKEIEECDSILIIGEDITQTSSRMALSIRQAIKMKSTREAIKNNIPYWHSQGIKNFSEGLKNPLFFIGSTKTKLHDIVNCSYIGSIQNQINILNSIYDLITKKNLYSYKFDKKMQEKVFLIYNSLVKSKKPLIISGSKSSNSTILKIVFNISQSLYLLNSNTKIAFLPHCTNSIGVSLFGGMTLNQAINTIQCEKIKTLIIMENNLYHWMTKNTIDLILKNIKTILVLDHQKTETLKQAHLVFPSSNSYESSGTVVNYEGRAQRFFKTYSTSFLNKKNKMKESWKWIYNINNKINKNTKDDISLDKITKLYSSFSSYLAPLKQMLPTSSTKIFEQKIPRSPNRASGRTALRSHVDIHEPKQPEDNDSMFSFSMEGSNRFYEYSSYIPFVWSPGWNSPQAWNKFQKEIGGDLKNGSPGILLFKEKIKKTIFFSIKNKKTSIRKNLFTVVPYYTLFGVDEISQYSPEIHHKIYSIYALISIKNAKEKNLESGSTIMFQCLNQTFHMSIKLSKTLSSKNIALPIGRIGFPYELLGKTIVNFQEVII
ncbi:NADH-quinone oxidoreductase subunit NuoG [Buchnera aphidicola]|uniref:NADH-quinone oxidoreductase subunit G n=1 Tax=Buchnera aphidicola (Anoecia oenotherae) TaxID=1241833 RepID=A0A4D6XPQ9_9GAMM|nr:NADH-quinone oxidoreductase subunit NuoG [Buchnera aphidicola]QCI19262.1 NADH-quinone oxidoreductase subunit NuoG [Buchnera aphidicola (Anoecia oenotherae)]